MRFRRLLIAGGQRWILFLVLALLLASTDSRAQSATGTIRVAPSGSDASGCGSIASSCRTLQFAVDEFPMESSGTILVVAGTYTSSSPREVLRITVGRNITLRGGYTTSFTAEDADANPVIIDGQSARRGITLDPTPALADPELTLVGVTLRNGRAPTDIGFLNSFGGGLDAFQATVTATDVKVIDNTAQGLASGSGLPGNAGGGGVSLRDATASLTQVEFIGNAARGGDGSGSASRGGLGVGGGIFADGSSLVLDGVTATQNTARGGDAPGSLGSTGIQRADGLGGFLALIRSSGSGSNLVANGNLAQGGVAATLGGLGLGGALFIEDADGTVQLTSIRLHENTALGAQATASTGGLGGGGAIFSTDGLLSIDGGILVANLAQGGDGIAEGGDGSGGGVYMDSVLAQPVALTTTNVIIAGNAVVAGSGTTPGFAFGGGIFQQRPAGPSNSATLTHVTLADNVVENGSFNQGSALYVSQGATASSDYGIVSGHGVAMGLDRGEAVLVWGTVTFNDTLYNGNSPPSGACPDCPFFAAPGGSFSDNTPWSGSPDYADPSATPPDYHILENSAAIDLAVGSTTPVDVDGQIRPFPGGGFADLGADEFFVPEPGAWLQRGAALALLWVLRRRGAGAAERRSARSKD